MKYIHNRFARWIGQKLGLVNKLGAVDYCKLGKHEWEVIKRARCKVHIGNLFTSGKVSGEARIEVCNCCLLRRGVVDTGFTSEEIDPVYLLRNM